MTGAYLKISHRATVLQTSSLNALWAIPQNESSAGKCLPSPGKETVPSSGLLRLSLVVGILLNDKTFSDRAFCAWLVSVLESRYGARGHESGPNKTPWMQIFFSFSRKKVPRCPKSYCSIPPQECNTPGSHYSEKQQELSVEHETSQVSKVSLPVSPGHPSGHSWTPAVPLIAPKEWGILSEKPREVSNFFCLADDNNAFLEYSYWTPCKRLWVSFSHPGLSYPPGAYRHVWTRPQLSPRTALCGAHQHMQKRVCGFGRIFRRLNIYIHQGNFHLSFTLSFFLTLEVKNLLPSVNPQGNQTSDG